MLVNIYVCNGCGNRTCFTSDAIMFNCAKKIFVKSEEYQITEKPEPVWVLDIPVNIQSQHAWIVAILKRFHHNGSVISETFAGIGKEGSYCFADIPEYCLKQKPQQPTAEELQERIDKIVEYVEGLTNVYKLSFTEIKGRISRLANGGQ